MRDFVVWIRDFWAARELSRPNGDMLFSYRATKAEYLSLLGVFAHKLECLNGQPWIFDSTADCACFVLYASEWWRREYSGGAWRWTSIFESMTKGPYTIDPYERSLGVERGLRATLNPENSYLNVSDGGYVAAHFFNEYMMDKQCGTLFESTLAKHFLPK